VKWAISSSSAPTTIASSWPLSSTTAGCDVVRGVDRVVDAANVPSAGTGHPTPSYLHVPIAVNAAGQKLSGRRGTRRYRHHQFCCLRRGRLISRCPWFVGVRIVAFWSWATVAWSPSRYP
jgi:hypothetical protein